MKNDERFNRASELWERRRLKDAFHLFLSAAADGDVASQTNLGYFYDCGIGTKKNKNAALRWYKKAHRRGDSSATINIGTIYRDRGETKRALQWFERALARGDDDGALEIGKIYVTEGNFTTAAKYLKRARKSRSVSEDTNEQAAELLKQVHQSRRRKSDE
jgi:TPR repeat protein